jgi:hypothetical protein
MVAAIASEAGEQEMESTPASEAAAATITWLAAAGFRTAAAIVIYRYMAAMMACKRMSDGMNAATARSSLLPTR